MEEAYWGQGLRVEVGGVIGSRFNGRSGWGQGSEGVIGKGEGCGSRVRE